MDTASKPARVLAHEVLLAFERTMDRLDDLSEQALARNVLNPRERRFFKTLVAGVVRHRLYLDWIGAQLYKGRYKKMLLKFKVLLRLALYEAVFLTSVPARATLHEYVQLARKKTSPRQAQILNGMLRSYIRQREHLKPELKLSDPAERLSILYSFPLWLVKRWLGFWGEEETAALCRKLNEPPQFELRINRQKIAIEQFKKLLAQQEIEYRTSSYFPDTVSVSDIQAVRQAGWFEKGYCVVQDESAHIPVEALQPQPDESVLDLCAAPGGKFTQILQKQEGRGRAVAVDINLQRLKRVKENVRHLGLSGGLFVCADARALPFKIRFDKILLDAPCSGLGVIRKHPDIKWRRNFDEIIEFSALQSTLLENAVRLLKPGGQLVYSTCTLDYMENENVVQNLLERFAEQVKLIEIPEGLPGQRQKHFLRTFPHRHNTDGSFCALLQKK